MTFERRDNPDECVTVHVAHRLRGEAARRACANFDPTVWRVRVVSTPDSILADLTHSRSLVDPTDGLRGKHDRRARRQLLVYSIGGVIPPEVNFLGICGLSAYL